MAHALARDFGSLPGVTVTLPRCPSLSWPDDLPASVHRGAACQDDELPRLARAHDAVLLVAPESADILHRLALLVESSGRRLLGATAAAIAVAGDKWMTSLALARAGVAQAPTIPAHAPWPSWDGPWVIKPADGCGCSGVYRHRDRQSAQAAMAQQPQQGTAWLAQPWIDGMAASLTVLGSPEGARLLTVNRQRLRVEADGKVELERVDTGALQDSNGRLAALARAVHAAIPGLNGVWGIDVVLDGANAYVVDVNPRVTSAYPALARAIDSNPAEAWLEGSIAPIATGLKPAALQPPSMAPPMRAAVLGWDIGGAHLKVAALGADGRLIDVVQRPCALWQGLDRLEPLLADLSHRWGVPDLHAITMSGEMVDLFPNRASGVAALVQIFVRHAGAAPVRIYGGAAGWLAPQDAAARASAIASANWLTMGDWAARQLGAGVVLDLGSTTCDALCFHDGCARPALVGDAGRLATGELVYTGIARTPLMALGHQVNLGGRPVGVMAEWFASTADVYRILGELPEGSDQHPSADGGPKTLEASVRRLARMVGCDGPEWPLGIWKDVARQFRTVQIGLLDEALVLALERLPPAPGEATVVVAGAGAFLAREACARHPVKVLDFDQVGDLLRGGDRTLATRAAHCAPAVAVAALAAQSA